MRFDNTLSKKTVVLLIAGIVLFIGYTLFEARRYLSGPSITIISPQDGDHFMHPFVTISGVIKNASFITLNGRRVFTDEEGRFTEALLLPMGYTVLVITAKDRFNREITVERHITVEHAKEKNSEI